MSDCEKNKEDANCCPVQKSACSDVNPINCSLDMWKTSFFKAMQDVQTDVLKEKIRKEWGPMMDKSADAVLRAMGTHWNAMLEQAKAKEDLQEAFRKILQSQTK